MPHYLFRSSYNFVMNYNLIASFVIGSINLTVHTILYLTHFVAIKSKWYLFIDWSHLPSKRITTLRTFLIPH